METFSISDVYKQFSIPFTISKRLRSDIFPLLGITVETGTTATFKVVQQKAIALAALASTPQRAFGPISGDQYTLTPSTPSLTVTGSASVAYTIKDSFAYGRWFFGNTTNYSWSDGMYGRDLPALPGQPANEWRAQYYDALNGPFITRYSSNGNYTNLGNMAATAIAIASTGTGSVTLYGAFVHVTASIAVTFTSFEMQTDASLREMYVVGSNDGTNWTVLFTGVTAPTTLTKYTLTNTGSFTQYKWVFTRCANNAFQLYRLVPYVSSSYTTPTVPEPVAPVAPVAPATLQSYPPIAMISNTQTVSGNAYGNGTYILTASTTGYANAQPYTLFDKNYSYGYWWQTNEGVYGYVGGVNGCYLGSVSTTIDSSTIKGEWFQLLLPAPIVLRSYIIYGFNEPYLLPNRTPRSWIIAGSTDGSTWHQLDSQVNVGWVYNTASRTINLPSNAASYAYYRLVITQVGNLGASTSDNSSVILSELSLMG